MYDLFVSHGWEYTHEYYKVLEYLDEISNHNDFSYINHSEPQHDAPSRKYTDELKVELRDQIDKSQAILVLSDMYKHYAYWLDFEMEYAQIQDKAIIGLHSWGERKTPIDIKTQADRIIGWNPDTLVKALRSAT